MATKQNINNTKHAQTQKQTSMQTEQATSNGASKNDPLRFFPQANEPTQQQAQAIQFELQWFQLYSESKGFMQKDVLNLIAPMQKTVGEWAEKDKSSPAYCKLKKQIVVKQAETASKAVLGRF
jgi:hypothetical protein